MTLGIKITMDAKEARDALDRLADPALDQRILDRVLNEVVQPALAKYPPQQQRTRTSVYGQPFVSAKQQRYFFAALASGAIAVPRQRTGDLGNPSNWERVPVAGGLLYRSSVAYSDFVLTRGQQARILDYWPDLESVADSLEGDAALAATAELVQTIGNAGP